MLAWYAALYRGYVGIILISLGCMLPTSLFPALCDGLLWILGIKIKVFGQTNLKVCDDQPHGVMVFNHPTMFDHIALMAAFRRPLSFVVLSQYLCGPSRWLASRLKCIFVDKKKGTTVYIQKAIRNRIQREPMIAIAPMGGALTDDPCRLAKFSTGAFREPTWILPVTLRYSYHKGWDNMFDVLKQRLTGEYIECQVTILPPMLPDHSKGAEYVSDCVKKAMETSLSTSDVQWNLTAKPISVLLCTSSFVCFGSSVWVLATSHKHLETFGVLLVLFNSLWYHGTGNHSARFVDMITNFTCAPLFATRALLLYRTIWPWIFTVVAAVGYTLAKDSNFLHLLCVHLPVWLGFLSIARA